MNHLKFLLHRVKDLNTKHEELFNLSGENFNIFQILGLSSDELSHSSFIASLLNPYGSHNKGLLFLQLFLDEIGIDNFCPINAKVETEKFIGKIDNNYDNGGRIDIVITENNSYKQILIENKIYAGDQEKQLFRYNESNNNSILIYLTLDGVDASPQSLNGIAENDYLKISYRENIIKWLEKCKKESVENPLLRETVTQYINLIKRLTGQSRSKIMENELLNILMSDDDNIDSAFTIANNISILKKSIIDEKLMPELQKLSKKFNLKLSINKNDYSSSYWGFDFSNEDWKYLKIRFEFQASDFRNLIFGFCWSGSNKNKLSKELVDRLNKFGKSSKAWPCYNYFDSYKDWGKEIFIIIANNKNNIENSFVVAIESKITILLQITEGFDI